MTKQEDVTLGVFKTLWYGFRSGAFKKARRKEIEGADQIFKIIAEYYATRKR